MGFSGCMPVPSCVRQHHSVEATLSLPFNAAFIVCQAKLAHFTLAGNLHTPDNIFSLPRRSSSSSSTPISPVSILWTLSNTLSASASDLPFSSVVIIEADALEMAQPDPL